MLKTYIKSYPKKLVKCQNYFTDYFKLEGGELYYIGKRTPLTTEGKLKLAGTLADILGKNRLRKLGFNIPVGNITAW